MIFFFDFFLMAYEPDFIVENKTQRWWGTHLHSKWDKNEPKEVSTKSGRSYKSAY